MAAPFAWVRKIANHLQLHDQIPPSGNAPQFDWSRFSTLLATRLGVQNLSIQAEKAEWRDADALKDGMGDEVLILPLKIGPLNGSAFWMMSQEEIAKLTSWILHGQAKAKPLSSEILAEGFYRYLALQALDVATTLEPLHKLSPLLSEKSPLPQTEAFCIDIEIEFDRRSCWGRLAIEPTFQKSWVQHFAKVESDYIPTKMAESVEVDLGVKVGGVLLHLPEWKKIKEGDVVLLDKGSYDPRKSQGVAYFTLGATPLFQVKIKHNKMQLLDYAFVYEEEMEKKMASNSEPPFSGPAESLPPSEGEAVAIKEMPVYVTVELARFRVTLEKLMQLAPGNLIELPIHPDQGVQLTVNGQIIGRAELVHLGEALGIRILEKG